jgi:RNA recognition motif-containing protein
LFEKKKEEMPRSKSRSRSRSATRSATPSPPRRSRSPLSDHENGNDRPTEYRIHIAELPQGTQESEIRKVFQRFGTLVDVWVASASCFAFVVFKTKEEAQKAIDQMDGRYDI